MDFSTLAVGLLLALVLAGFVAGFIDAIAGGGGMIQVPSLLLAGVPPIGALATNKIISLCGTCLVVGKYAASNLINWRWAALGGGCCLLGGLVGSALALRAPSWFLEYLIVVSIVVALYTSLRISTKIREGKEAGRPLRFSSLVGAIGLYDGLAGPGTGAFLALANLRTLNLDLLRATALAKPINLMSNLGAAAVFIGADSVEWSLAVPMLLANCAGNWLGGRFAILKGSNLIKGVLITILSLLLALNIYHMLA